MKREYYDKEHHSNLLKNIQFYSRVDLLIKLSVSLVVFISLLFVGSLWLAIAVFAVLAAVKAAGWIFIKTLQFVLKKWFGALTYKIGANLFSGEQIGNFRLKQVDEWVAEICREIGVSTPAELLVYDSKYANAFASQERWVGLVMRNRVVLLTNIFHLLNEEELKAIIAHEIGHHQHYPDIGVLPQILIPWLTDRPSYRWSLEHLSDWYAAKIIGVVPTANALIKVHHRGHLMREIGKGLEYVQKDFKIGLAGISEFQEIVNDVIPDKIRPDENLDKYMERVVDKYFERRSPKMKGVGRTHVEKYRRESKTERRVLKSRHKLLDWRIFDARVRDNNLDGQELEVLYLHLKENQNVRFFFSYIMKNSELEKWSSHPPLRERITFIVEAVEPVSE